MAILGAQTKATLAAWWCQLKADEWPEGIGRTGPGGPALRRLALLRAIEIRVPYHLLLLAKAARKEASPC